MPVTIYDIAEHAGVSIATVSRVFSGPSRVAQSTRERVFSVARELGYTPNVSARNLARQTTQVVSALVPMMTSYFFMEVIRGVQDRLSEDNYDLLVYVSRSSGEMDAQLERAVQPGRADGLLFCSATLSDEHAARLADSGYPIGLVDTYHPTFDSVIVDNEAGGHAAASHLLAQGCRDLALILPHPEPQPGIQRRKGFERALSEVGIELPSSRVFVSDDLHRHGYTQEVGYEGMRQLLAQGPPPDGVFAACDDQAFGALTALREAGLSVPDDVQVVGFDDIQISAYAGLTTLRQPMYEIGKSAADRLLRRLQQPDAPVQNTTYSASLIERETTTTSASPIASSAAQA